MPVRRQIGVNALYLIPGGVGGTEIYLRNLLSALAEIDNRNRYLIFTNRETGSSICPEAKNFEAVVSPVPGRVRSARLLWEQTVLPIQTLKYRLDVLFCPGFSSPLACGGGKVTVIHDLQHKRQPENFGFWERQAWRAMVWTSARYSTKLLTVSENSRRDIVEVYGLPEKRISVVRHGVEQDFFGLQENQAYDSSLPWEAGVPACQYLLAVSTLHPHKNWFRLLDAYQAIVKDGRPEHLVIAGLQGKAWEKVQEHVQKMEYSSRVHLVGWQPRRVLLGLFKFAEALVFPSTFEGFGLPVIEAMAAGVPVVCSDIPPLREIADGAALFCDPESSDALAERLRDLLNDPSRRERLIKRGLERAAQFSWRQSAEQTLAVLLEAARS